LFAWSGLHEESDPFEDGVLGKRLAKIIKRTESLEKYKFFH
jgi:hypothetical protein